MSDQPDLIRPDRIDRPDSTQPDATPIYYNNVDQFGHVDSCWPPLALNCPFKNLKKPNVFARFGQVLRLAPRLSCKT